MAARKNLRAEGLLGILAVTNGARTVATAARLARMLKVLSVGTRTEILRLLKGRALCVNALAARLNVTQGAVSQHLKIMRDAGLVVDEKRGNFVHYRLNEKTLAAWQEEIGRLLDPNPPAGGHTKGA
jgi:DNA-binding transcriptional ArsR family regulator